MSSNRQTALQLLAACLRDRRTTMPAHAADGPPNPRSPTRHLTHFHVARAGGIGIRSYQDVEAGRRPPGPHVLSGIAQVLELTTAEHAYLQQLARAANNPQTTSSASAAMIQAAAGIVNRYPGPAYLADHHWNLLAANQPIKQAVPTLVRDGNILDWFFTSKEAPRVLPDWPADAADLIGTVRIVQAHHDIAWYEQKMTQLADHNPTVGELWKPSLTRINYPGPLTSVRFRCRNDTTTRVSSTRVAPEGAHRYALHIALIT